MAPDGVAGGAPGGSLGAGLPREVLLRYEVLDLLGEGAMGQVFRAFDLRLQRTVALKVVRREHLARAKFVARFRREGALLARMRHPNIVALLDVDDAEGAGVLAMEYVPGVSLALRLAAGPLTAAETARVGLGLAVALAEVHRAGVLHRDVKPGNVLLAPDGTPKLSDFGLSSWLDQESHTAFTATCEVVGTPLYLAPEVLRGGAHSPQSDLYSLGAVLYQCLTTFPPWSATALSDLARGGKVPPLPSHHAPGLETTLDELIAGLLAMDPAERPASGDEVAAVLEAWIASREPAPDVSADGRLGLDATSAVSLNPRAERGSWARLAAAFAIVAAVTALCARWREAPAPWLPPSSASAPAPASAPSAAPAMEPTTAALVDGVVASAHGGRLWLDFATNLPTAAGLEVDLARLDGSERCVRSCPAPRGPVVLDGLGWTDGRPRRFQLRWRGHALAGGVIDAAVDGVDPAFRPWATPSGLRGGPVPQAGPLWVGSRFVVTDCSGAVTCWEPRRFRAVEAGSTPVRNLRRAFVFVPPGQPSRDELPLVRGVAGLTALPGGRVLVAAQLAGRQRLVFWALDVDARAREWARRSGGEGLPAFVEDAADPWNRPLDARETVDEVVLPFAGAPVGDGLAGHGAAVMLLGPDRPRWLAWDAEARRVLWLRQCPVLPRSGRVGPLQARLPRAGMLVAGELAVTWAPNAFFGTSSSPVRCAGRIYTLICAGGPGSPLLSCLASFPDRAPAANEPPLSLFWFEGAPGHQDLAAEPGSAELWVCGCERLFRFAGGAATPATSAPLTGFPPSGTLGYASGAPLQVGDRLLVGGVSYPTGEGRDFLDWLSGRAQVELVDVAPASGVALPHRPPFVVQMGHAGRPDAFRGPTPCGPVLVGWTTFRVAALDPDTGRSGSWEAPGELLMRAAPGPEGYVALATVEGRVALVPAPLLPDPRAAPLEPRLPAVE